MLHFLFLTKIIKRKVFKIIFRRNKRKKHNNVGSKKDIFSFWIQYGGPSYNCMKFNFKSQQYVHIIILYVIRTINLDEMKRNLKKNIFFISR